MTRRSQLQGDLSIRKRTDSTGGNLYVEGQLTVNQNGEAVDLLALSHPSFTWTQATPATVWTIQHPLKTSTPYIKLFVGGEEVLSRAAYETATDDSIEIHFAVPCVGTAVLMKIKM